MDAYKVKTRDFFERLFLQQGGNGRLMSETSGPKTRAVQRINSHMEERVAYKGDMRWAIEGHMHEITAEETKILQKISEELVKERSGITEREIFKKAFLQMERVVETANEESAHGDGLIVLAGRKSPLESTTQLTNLYTKDMLEPFLGTASIQAAKNFGIPEMGARLPHEVIMAVNKLIGQLDQHSYQISPLVAHLLWGAITGNKIALPDTYGTFGFLQTCTSVSLPDEALRVLPFVPQTRSPLSLFDTWRIDSGKFTTQAQAITKAYTEANLTPPTLMCSNIGSCEHIRALWRLPRDIRPSVLGIGSLFQASPELHLPIQTATEPSPKSRSSSPQVAGRQRSICHSSRLARPVPGIVCG